MQKTNIKCLQKMIEYKAKRPFAHHPPQILPNNLSLCTSDIMIIGSQSNLSCIHLVNTTSQKYISDKSSQSSEFGMNSSQDFQLNTIDVVIMDKINKLNSIIQECAQLVSTLENGANIINKNIDQMETHLMKIRRYYIKRQIQTM
ncbi:Hypothetical_protein [Hexamita inflata]|uniref:Hypothetical_protein n=1 Tax=Hexamita inflata TaxID=28002 RepID=A0AA86QUT0_9EUKA|nr:Hypothetical protein HINF_LOCUS54066 [Hexamita inflata]